MWACLALPARRAAVDEVYGRSEELRKACARAGLAYVAIIPCDYRVTLAAGVVIRADEAVARHCQPPGAANALGTRTPRPGTGRAAADTTGEFGK